MPKNIFAFLSLKKIGDTLLFQQNDKSVAFLMYYETEKILYIWYLAVFPEYRNKGIGTQILEFVMDYAKNTNRAILIDAEWPDENAEDNEERIKRKNFYESLGFYGIGKAVNLYGSMTKILTTKELCLKEYHDDYKKTDKIIEDAIQSLDDEFFRKYGGDKETFIKLFEIVSKERIENSKMMLEG